MERVRWWDLAGRDFLEKAFGFGPRGGVLAGRASAERMEMA
jgi:hypothetical protein